MPAESTYLVRIDNEERWATNEAILTTSPYIEQAAVLGIMNNFGSESIVRIKEIQCNEVVGRTTTGLISINLYRITALTGGTAVTPSKHDSSASALPSQVQAVKYPNSVTTTGSYLRMAPSLTGLTMTSLAAHMGFSGGSRYHHGGMNLNHIYTNHDSNVQIMVLREGEGIAFRNTLTAPQNHTLELVLHMSDGTNTYRVNEVLTLRSATELFAILNGTGSGIVLYVSRIELRNIRTADISCFIIETCSEMYNGTAITPISLDSDNAAIDSLVEFRNNCVVRQGNTDALAGRNARAGGDVIPFRRLVMPTFGKGVALASGALRLQRMINRVHNIDAVNTVGQIVLREGEGLAILQRVNFGGYGLYEFAVLFTVEDSGGAPSAAFPIFGGRHVIQARQ